MTTKKESNIPDWKRCDMCGKSPCVIHCNKGCDVIYCSQACADVDEKTHSKWQCPDAVNEIGDQFIALVNLGAGRDPVLGDNIWHAMPGPLDGNVPPAFYGKDTMIFHDIMRVWDKHRSDANKEDVYYFIAHEDVRRVLAFRLSSQQFQQLYKLINHFGSKKKKGKH